MVLEATCRVALASRPCGSLGNRQEEAAHRSLFSPKAGFEASEEIGGLITCFPLTLGIGGAPWPLAPKPTLESYLIAEQHPDSSKPLQD